MSSNVIHRYGVGADATVYHVQWVKDAEGVMRVLEYAKARDGAAAEYIAARMNEAEQRMEEA